MIVALPLLVWFAGILSAQLPARAIEIWSEHPIAVDIEWLTIDEAGNETITARRQTAVGLPVPLAFVPGPDRYVRFLYQGASPRTYSTSELLGVRKLHVPDVLPGGELLLFIPAMTVRPIQLLVEGPRGRVASLDSAIHVSLSGMTAGDYRLVPVYEGGLYGAPTSTTVQVARTTVVVLPAEKVGAVRIAATPDVCGVAQEMGISAEGASPGRRRIVTSREPRCEMTFAGIPPGKFEVFYRGERGPGGSSLFEIAPQTVSTVMVSAPPVSVHGQVTMNGKPLADVRLGFTRRAPHETAVVTAAQTDAAGHYFAGFDKPGEYAVRVMHPRAMFGGPKNATFVEGTNTFDLALTGGVIKVELTGAAEGSRVSLTIESRRGVIGGAALTMGQPHEFGGLAFGEYKVVVRLGSPDPRTPPASPQHVKSVTLTAASPEATVTFDLNK